jgi:hypothetical protein
MSGEQQFIYFLTVQLEPKVIVEWLALLTRIRELSSSDLPPETGRPIPCVSWYSSLHPGKCRTSFVYILHNSAFTDNLIIRRYVD